MYYTSCTNFLLNIVTYYKKRMIRWIKFYMIQYIKIKKQPFSLYLNFTFTIIFKLEIQEKNPVLFLYMF